MCLAFSTKTLCEIVQNRISIERYRQPALKEMLTVVPPEEQLIVLRLYAEKRIASGRRTANLDDRPAMAAQIDAGRFNALSVEFIDPCGRKPVGSGHDLNSPKSFRH